MLVSHGPLISYPQIYNEVIRDLLNPSSGFLDLREDPRGSIQIAGITEVSTTNAQEVPGAMVHGEEKGRRIVLACNSNLKFHYTSHYLWLTQQQRPCVAGPWWSWINMMNCMERADHGAL